MKKMLRGKLEKVTTINKARREAQKLYNEDIELNVRCYTVDEDDIFTTDLQIEINGEDVWETIYVARVEVGKYEVNDDFWNFQETSCKMLATMKKNLIKELELYNIKITHTDDYNC